MQLATPRSLRLLGLLVVQLAMRSATVSAKGNSSLIGPYMPYVNAFFQCASGESDESMVVLMKASDYSHFKLNEKQTITGNVTGKTTLDESMWLRIRIDGRNKDQWKENILTLNFPSSGCTALRKNVPDFFRVVFKKHANSNPCVVPVGTYIVNQEEIDWVLPSIPVAPYGRYRFVIHIGKAKTKNLCFMADATVIPRIVPPSVPVP